MNKVKYRAWHEENKCFAPTPYWYLDPIGLCRWSNNNEEANLVIQQFVGISDKNNFEIYEGDYIRYTSGRDQINEILEVKWCENRLGFIFCNGRCRSTNENNWYGTYEVVGNIFENKMEDYK